MESYEAPENIETSAAAMRAAAYKAARTKRLTAEPWMFSVYPKVCLSCGADFYDFSRNYTRVELYEALMEEGFTRAQALDNIGLRRYCCRQHFQPIRYFWERPSEIKEQTLPFRSGSKEIVPTARTAPSSVPDDGKVDSMSKTLDEWKEEARKARKIISEGGRIPPQQFELLQMKGLMHPEYLGGVPITPTTEGPQIISTNYEKDVGNGYKVRIIQRQTFYAL